MDHYTNFNFVPVYWQSFVREARKTEEQTQTADIVHDEHAKLEECHVSVNSNLPVKDQKLGIAAPEHEIEEYPENLTLIKRNGHIVGSHLFTIICTVLLSTTLCAYMTGSLHANVRNYLPGNRKKNPLTLAQNQILIMIA